MAEIDFGQLSEALNEKMDRDVQNIDTSVGGGAIINALMPDFDNGVTLTFNSSLNYAAPCDGFMLIKGNTISADLYTPNDVEVLKEYWLSANYSCNVHPLPKGYKCKYRSGNSQYAVAIFYPCKGF